MATIPELQQLQKAMRTETSRDDLQMMQVAQGMEGPPPGMEGPPSGMGGPPPGMGGPQPGMGGPPPGMGGPPPGMGGPQPGMGGPPPLSRPDQLNMNQDVHDILFTAPPSLPGESPKDSIAAKAIESLLKNANLDIMGMMAEEEDGRLEAASGGGLMKLAAGGEFSGRVPGQGHGMQDNVRMPIKEGRNKVATLAVSPTEYVVDSHTMAALGNGNADAGADVMDQVVKGVRQQAYGTRKQPNEINGLAALRPMIERA